MKALLFMNPDSQRQPPLLGPATPSRNVRGGLRRPVAGWLGSRLASIEVRRAVTARIPLRPSPFLASIPDTSDMVGVLRAPCFPKEAHELARERRYESQDLPC